MEQRIVVVLVDYGSKSSILSTVTSLNRAMSNAPSGLMIDLVYVQNDPAVTSLYVGLPSKPERRRMTLWTGANLGYVRGAREGLATVGIDADWLVISNVDLLFPDTFFNLFEGESYADGIRAPQVRTRSLVEAGGHLENPYSLLRPKLWHLVRSVIITSSPLMHRVVVTVRERMRHFESESAQRGRGKADLDPTSEATQFSTTYAVHGSCFALSKRLLQLDDDLTGAPFLFGEEQFLADLCRIHGLAVRFAPAIIVDHIGHVSTGFRRGRAIISLQRREAVRQLNWRCRSVAREKWTSWRKHVR